jgi:hypothetical protein
VSNILDIGKPAPGHEINVTIQREEAKSERNVRLFKELTLFLAGIGFVALIIWICVNTLSSPGASAEEKKWAMSIISAAAGGIIGYLVRK